MTQVKDKTDQHLNMVLAELMGVKIDFSEGIYQLTLSDGSSTHFLRKDEVYKAWELSTNYASDPAASLEVQAKAIEVDADEYVQNLAIVKWGEPDEDVEDTAVWNKTMRYSIAELLTASPRERAEAAYITLQGAKGNG